LASSEATAGARALNALFFFAVSAFGFLSYSPFGYQQFIQPNVLPALRDFVTVSPWLFWLVLLVTVLTLMPHLRGAPGRGLARAYVGLGVLLGGVVMIRPPLPALGSSWRAFALGLIALVPPVWLAILDHAVWPPPALRSHDRRRALTACALTAMAAWAVFALSLPLRLPEVVGIDLSSRALAFGLGASFVVDLAVFMALGAAMVAAMGAAQATGRGATGEFWLLMALLGGCSAVTLYTLVCEAIAFTGVPAAITSVALGVTFAGVWADLARLRAQSAIRHTPSAIDPLALFSAPIAGVRSRRVAYVVLAILPVATYELVETASHLDWNFLVQKMSVMGVWLVTFAAVAGAIGDGRPRERRAPAAALVAVPVTALLALAGLGWIARRPDAASVVDRYAAADPSFRLVRDAGTTRSSDTIEYYGLLRSHTLVAAKSVQSPGMDPVQPPGARDPRPPDIYLFVIDSLRRDYVSPYNPAVTFTPELAKLAADSFVFDRAFTRYSGTALAVPAMWAGGMLIHIMDQPDFGRRNALLALVDTSRFVRLMSREQFPKELLSSDGPFDEIDRGKDTMQVELCATIDQLRSRLNAARPLFFYSLPQNVHLAVAGHQKVPPTETYPGFAAPIASSVRRVDACLGQFVDRLKAADRYDNSIIVVTSDHGDSLGEEGRWGHAYFVYPEVMRIPLIVHVPSRLRARLTADVAAVGFSTDITPSLYALLGYHVRDDGPLVGRSLFVAPESAAANAAWRRGEQFLVASSYGAIYGILRQNGERLYVVDAEDGRDYAYDFGVGLLGHRLAVTQAMTDDYRRTIAQQLADLAALYRYQPRR